MRTDLEHTLASIPPGREQRVTAPAHRVHSIDALRGFVMFMMIFVNDLAGAGRVVPDWMVHFSDRHHGGSGMTFVDLVFPAFLFLMGMSIPFALGSRLEKGEPVWKVFGHVVLRTALLLWIGIMMVNETPDSAAMGWSGNWWCVLMYLSAILALSSIGFRTAISEHDRSSRRVLSQTVRWCGFAGLILLAFAFRGAQGQRIISLAPFSVHTEWYGILGLIGCAYLMGSIVFLAFRLNRTAILGCMVLLMCLFAADRAGAFEGFWLPRFVGIGESLGSLAAISTGGLLLGSRLAANDGNPFKSRTVFTIWFVLGCAAAALLLNRTYGISKNSATPSWCLWSCAITAALWYVCYLICDIHPVEVISRPMQLAGRNVLLAYLISEMLPGLIAALHLEKIYGAIPANLPLAITRSVLCAIFVLVVSTGLNRAGFRLKL
jgi:predicted acyltransferase